MILPASPVSQVVCGVADRGRGVCDSVLLVASRLTVWCV